MPQRQGSDPWPPEEVWAQLDHQMLHGALVPVEVSAGPEATFSPANAYYQMAYVQDQLDAQKGFHYGCRTSPVGLICVAASDGQVIVWPTNHPGCLFRILTDTAAPVTIVGLCSPETWGWTAPRDLSELEFPW